MKSLFVFPFLCLCVPFPGFVADARSAPEESTRTPVKVSAPEKARIALFSHLKTQTGSQSDLPGFPADKLLSWIDGRNASVAPDSKSRYRRLFEHLLIAQLLLESDDLATRKRGFWVVSESANFAAAKLPDDKWLLSRLYEGWLLPFVSLANAQVWEDPSRQRIIEAAVSAFESSNERPRQIAVLEWLLSLGNKAKEAPSKTSDSDVLVLETNTLDWARGTLASVLFTAPGATKAEIKRALALLQSIESPTMSGFEHLKERVQARFDELQNPSATKNEVTR